jgi:hypothetical protein
MLTASVGYASPTAYSSRADNQFSGMRTIVHATGSIESAVVWREYESFQLIEMERERKQHRVSF